MAGHSNEDKRWRYNKGFPLCPDGVPEGYGIGELVNPNVAVVYFGKSVAGDYLFHSYIP
jgi:hypothetical protein